MGRFERFAEKFKSMRSIGLRRKFTYLTTRLVTVGVLNGAAVFSISKLPRERGSRGDTPMIANAIEPVLVESTSETPVPTFQVPLPPSERDFEVYGLVTVE